MQAPRDDIFRKKCETAIAALADRNISGFYFEDRNAAIAAIHQMIPDGSVVGLGGSVTIVESGLVEALRGRNISLLDRYRDGVSSEEVARMRHEGLSSDVFISSANAVTADGKIVNMDGYGNRVASIIFGPTKVVLMCGANKVVPNVHAAVARIRNVAAPMNSRRFNADTPCGRTGFCDESACRPPYRICGQLSIIECSPSKERLNVVFVGEELGF